MRRFRLAFKGFGLRFSVRAEEGECTREISEHGGRGPSRIKADKLPAPLRYAPSGDTRHPTAEHETPRRAEPDIKK